MSTGKNNDLMQAYLNKASQNIESIKVLDDNRPDKHFETKILGLFYIALYYLHALASMKGIYIGESHVEVERNCNPDRIDPSMPITREAWYYYKALFKYSLESRYDPLVQQARQDYEYCLEILEKFRKYIRGKGVPI